MHEHADSTLPQAQMADPDIAGNPKEFQPIAQKAAELDGQVQCLAKMQSLEHELEGARSMLKEAEGRYLPPDRPLHHHHFPSSQL